MVRGKTQMKRIESNASRQVTFSKRRNGLLKKAFELSVLCDAEVAAVVFSPSGKLYEFSSSSMSNIIERYQRKAKDPGSSAETTENDLQMQNLKGNSLDMMVKKIELLDISKRRLLGEVLDTCSIEELQSTQNQLERSLSRIRARKNQILKGQTEQLKHKEKKLLDENRKLRAKFQNDELEPLKSVTEPQEVPRGRGLDVETELSIGCPRRQRLYIDPHEDCLSIH
ncbi:MADS-box protein SOC1-like isoform X2 [Rhodamnia argentea]|uniref:MADS-box protein SOC1-like isoform X2 n=1 Tax=Rhodamnia argentea TaxID=178133 RepID=A0A8B8PTG5_9MYRT|nr:MADS-box protein SOC1-like isoform X2 [Rhodamnia argentea]